MKFLIIFLFVVSSVGALAKGTAYLATSVQDLPDFVVIKSSPCETVYYAPKSYVVDTAKSSILKTSVKAADGTSKPFLQFTFAIKPRPISENGPLKKELDAYIQSACPGLKPQLQLYPVVLHKIDVSNHLTGAEALPEPAYYSPETDVISFRVSPSQLSRYNLLKYLKFLKGEQILHVFSEKIDALVQLNADYAGAAELAEHYFTIKQCAYVHRCHPNFLLFRTCEDENQCTDVPKMIQAIQSMEYHNRIQFQIYSTQHVSEGKINKLEEELMSRLMRSLYLESSRIEFADMTMITLGQLKKQENNSYHDEASIRHFDENYYTSPIRIEGLDTFSSPILSRLYSSVFRDQP